MELYHVLNRGVEKRDIFMDDRDRFRFVHGLLFFNTSKPANNTTYLLQADNDFVNRYLAAERIVDIHAWCLMKNHYHLLLSERIENGLTLFLRKLNVGYANYFNERYKRSGSLYQGRTKKVHVHSDPHFLHILHYIHLNPLDYIRGAQNWREGRIEEPAKAKMQLEKYRWSSYLDYRGYKNFPSLLTTGFFKDSIGDVEKQTLAYFARPKGVIDDPFPNRLLE
jgi:putative transposase